MHEKDQASLKLGVTLWINPARLKAQLSICLFGLFVVKLSDVKSSYDLI